MVLLPAADTWLACADRQLFATLALSLAQLPASAPLLLLGTSDADLGDLPPECRGQLAELFSHDRVALAPPQQQQREAIVARLREDILAPVARADKSPNEPRCYSRRIPDH